jgi:hypothetical protein
MAANFFTLTSKTIATSSTPKSCLGFNAPANQAVRLLDIDIAFDGVTTTVPDSLIEICMSTLATNSTPGTNNTIITPVTVCSAPETIQTAGLGTWTSEPTVLTVVRSIMVPSCMGSAIAIPCGYRCAGGFGIVLRVTAPSGATPNVTLTMHCEE